MSYQGYRIKIGDTIVPNLLISKGSYSFRKNKRVAGSWTDANGIGHYANHKARQAVIQFSIKERNLEEHQSIAPIFAAQDNLTVEYWDEYACEYVTGNFRMSEPQIKHIETPGNDIRYATAQIVLTEY